ncbi:ThuA domain-containing protein [Arundinibacter roseus]|uniref:ThuA-like domain-containing protein n=1 Tax=Arundinibacter roseus TaxID=2070510 RepID=A0A4R4JZN3_9BACT|nr:ThuA domain-containing protein [Arundinibacter roseus]TDB60430.1 hypothetical protein EZE20_21090 [Arundinibacter roseus]
MKKLLSRILPFCVALFSLSLTQSARNRPTSELDAGDFRVVYRGDKGPGLGKNIVFIASDHEYRGEESLPALARILAKYYGFTCTVIFALDDEGYILPGGSAIKGLSALETADLLVLFTRFSDFEDQEMQQIDNYVRRGGPIVALRTSTHAFNIKNNPKWQHYDYRYNGPKTEWKDGFGKYILGETWVSHYGTNHKQSSRLIIDESQKNHPIFKGVKDMWVQSGAYTAEPKGTVLAYDQPLNGMKPDSPADLSKKPVPVAWTKNYQVENGKSGRSFTTTHGASEDILNEGFRRMLINAAFWAMGMEKQIKASNPIAFVGPYTPTTFNFDGYKAQVKPSMLAGWDALIMPGEVVVKKK